MEKYYGWIDEIDRDNKVIWFRLIINGREEEFEEHINILHYGDREKIKAGSYVEYVQDKDNFIGHLQLSDVGVWTAEDLAKAQIEADKLYSALNWS